MLRERRLAAAARLADATEDLRFCVEAYSAMEVPIYFSESLLAGRARCYRAAGDPRALAAESDLLDLIAREGAFGFTIPSPPPPPKREPQDASADGAD
jgi:hypothetical protein